MQNQSKFAVSSCARLLGATALALTALSATTADATPMHVSGRQLLDACGAPFVVRGVEQGLGRELPPGNDWLGLVEEISNSGANAVRILPGVTTLTVTDVDAVLTLIGQRGMIAYIDPLNGGTTWLARADVKTMLAKHESYLIIDAYGEPQYDNREQWRSEAKAAIKVVRALGYKVPITVTANQFGRDLPSILTYGAEFIAADPLHNVMLGWQAYWGKGGYYQGTYGLSLTEAVKAIVDSNLPIQMGLDHITDLPSTEADYGVLMAGAEANDISWLWWDWYNPYGSENNLSKDGTANNLTDTGKQVVNTHAASIANTARLVCSGPSFEPIAVNAGGGAGGDFDADVGFTGGTVAPKKSVSIDRTLVAEPAPELVYQTERWGAMSYKITGLVPNAARTVDLHFAEVVFTKAAQRKFHVNINGTRVLTDFDIFKSAGAKNRAIVKSFDVTANAKGEIVVAFLLGSVNQPKLSGLVVK